MDELIGRARAINSTNYGVPQFFDYAKDEDRQTVRKIFESNSNLVVVDIFEDEVRELSTVKDPSLLSKFSEPSKKTVPDLWVYLPWRNTIVRLLNKNDFLMLRRSRNLNLITADEQEKLESVRVGIAGLNVGNPAALCMALEGVSKMKLADNDILSVSNLNRFRASITDLGLNKAVLSAYQIYETNPFINLEVFSTGISPENINSFLLEPKLDILVEEMDNLPLKILIREKAKANRIPVVMVTGNGPNVIIDVERFDIEPDLPLLSGNLKPKIIEVIKSGKLSGIKFEQKMELMQDFIGKDFLVERLRSSFIEVGKTLAGIPQLAESSFLRGAVVAYTVRQIVTGAKVPSGRYYLKLENVLQ